MLKQFIRLIIEAAENDAATLDEINNLFRQIVDRFSHELDLGPGGGFGLCMNAAYESPLTTQRQAFWKRYRKYTTFEQHINKSSIYRREKHDINFLNAKVVSEYIKEELKAFDVFVYFDEKLHVISCAKLKQLMNIAKNYEEFEVMTKRVVKEV